MSEIKEFIYKEYPKFFETDPRYPSAMFGIECGDGWDDIILEMCKDLKEYFSSTEEDFDSFHFTQIKEKFGTLRVYCSFYNDEIDIIIRKAVLKSSQTCEITGTSGEVREINGWLSCLCDAKYNEYMKDKLE